MALSQNLQQKLITEIIATADSVNEIAAGAYCQS